MTNEREALVRLAEAARKTWRLGAVSGQHWCDLGVACTIAERALTPQPATTPAPSAGVVEELRKLPVREEVVGWIGLEPCVEGPQTVVMTVDLRDRILTALQSEATASRQHDKREAELDETVHRAAVKWCGEKDRETFPEDIAYFKHNWRTLPGFRDRVKTEALDALMARAILTNGGDHG